MRKDDLKINDVVLIKATVKRIGPRTFGLLIQGNHNPYKPIIKVHHADIIEKVK